MKKNLRILSLLLVILFALCAFVACTPAAPADTASDSETPSSQTDASDSAAENKITITVDVVGKDGNTTTFTISTAAETLRGALEQENLVQGEEGPYGLYIKTVNGETADFDTDGAYWALYEGDKAAMSGADGIRISEDGYYKLVYTK